MNNIPSGGDVTFSTMYAPNEITQELAITLECMLDGFFCCDAQWRFIHINSTAERILGVDRHDILGKSHWDVFPLTLGTKLEIEYRRAAAGEVRDFENFYAPWQRWFHNRCFPRQHGGFAVYFREITEQKNVEMALVQERNMLQTILNGALHSHLVYLDCDFNFIRVNKAYAKTCGFRPEEMIGKNHFALYPHPENENIFRKVRDTGEPYEVFDKPFEFPDQPDRGITYWDWSLSPVKNELGEVLGLVFSLFDTTEKKRATEEIIRLNATLEQQVAEWTSALEQTLIALDASEYRYRNVVEDQTEVIFRFGPNEHTFTFVNATLCRFLGKTKEELIGQPWYLMIIDEDLPRVKAILESLCDTNPVVSFESRVHDVAGTMHWVQFSCRAICDKQGRLLEIQSVGHQITERKHLEEQLQKSEEKYRSLVETTSECIWETNAQGKFTYLSPRLMDMTGYSPEELLGKTSLALLPKKDQKTVGEKILVTMTSRKPFKSLHHTIRHRNGHSLTIDTSAAPIFDNGGEFLGFRGVTRDISEQKLLTDALAASEEKFRSLVESTSDCIWEMNKDGCFTYISPTFETITGYPVSSFLGKTVSDLLPPDSKFRNNGSIQEFMTVSHFSLETAATHRNGQTYMVEVSGVPIFDSSGKCFGFRGITRNITERWQLMEALRENEEKYRIIFENELTGVFVYDIALNKFMDVNETFITLYGYSREEIFSKMTLLDFSAEPEKSAQSVTKSSQLGTNYVPLRHHRKKDGSVFPVEIFSGTAVIAGKKALFAMVHDISDRKRLEYEREQYVRFFNIAPDVMCITDQVGHLLQVNPAFPGLLGLTDKEMINHSFSEFVYPDDFEKSQIKMEQQLVSEPVYNFENRYVSKGGDLIWLSWCGVYNSSDGKIYATARDITERKRMEEGLRIAEAYARNLIEVNLDPLVTIDAQGKISDVNEASTQATGYSREEMIGTDFSAYFTEPDKAQTVYLQVFESGVIRDHFLEIRHKDGHITPVLYNASVFIDENQKIVGVFAAARDISRLKQVEEQLKVLNAQLEYKVEERTRELQESQKQVLHAEKLASIGMLSASIAHEFNNPLQGIMMILKGLKKWANLDDKERGLVAAAISESERIKNLIRGLQEFNRPSSGRKMLMSIHQALDSLLLLQSSVFLNKRIRIEREYADNLPEIEAIPDQIKQVFLNLLTNACDACTRKDKIISISTRREGNAISVSIKDTGVGIAPENMDRIFQPFFSTKGSVKGIGLGLSVSFGIIQAHKGKIDVTSCPGEGTTFTVFLPIYDSK